MPRKQRAMSGSAAARIHMENHNIRLRSGSAGHRPLSGDEDEESDHEEPIQVSPPRQPMQPKVAKIATEAIVAPSAIAARAVNPAVATKAASAATADTVAIAGLPTL
jgi:hypothetical protein